MINRNEKQGWIPENAKMVEGNGKKDRIENSPELLRKTSEKKVGYDSNPRGWITEV